MLNRSAFIVTLKQSFVDWINSTDEDLAYKITVEEANEDSTIYLVEAEDIEEFHEWLKLNGDIVFEELLEEWCTDPEFWPDYRNYKKLLEWCSREFHSLIVDTGGSAIEDDEAEYEE